MTVPMMLLLVCISIPVIAEIELDIVSFKYQDRNRDGKLTHAQFIQGLTITFEANNIEKNPKLINNFGREFLGEHLSNGLVELTQIEQWINNGDLLNYYEEWKTINDEGEEHHKATHQHINRRMHFPKMGRGPKRAEL